MDEGTVLVVDDNPANLALAETVLRTAGYRVRVALDGAAALEGIRKEAPDLVLLDVHMPRMDGYATCAAIKSAADTSEIPVIFLSGMDEPFNKVQAFKTGGVDYVVKPFQTEELLARVGTHLELSRSRRRVLRTLEELRERDRRLAESEKRRALATLGAGLAHELNNPINFIVLGTESLSKDFGELLSLTVPTGAVRGSERWKELAEEIPQLLEALRMGSDRASRIVKSLKYFQDGHPLPRIAAEPAALARQALSLALERYGANGVELETDFSELPPLLCNPEKITELLFHLILNALDAASLSDRPWVRLRLAPWSAPDGDYAEFSVEDSGPGVPHSERGRIFDPFYTTKEIGRGTGLGLPIALHIASEHRGCLELLPSGPPGAHFRVLLPLGAASPK